MFIKIGAYYYFCLPRSISFGRCEGFDKIKGGVTYGIEIGFASYFTTMTWTVQFQPVLDSFEARVNYPNCLLFTTRQKHIRTMPKIKSIRYRLLLF